MGAHCGTLIWPASGWTPPPPSVSGAVDPNGCTPTPPFSCTPAGMEKIIRIFDLNQPESAPAMFPVAPANLRGCTFIQNDTALLVSYVDRPNLG